MAQGLEKLGRYEEAITHYESAISMETESLDYRYAVSKALLSIQQYDQSLKEIDVAIFLGSLLYKNYTHTF